ncbi:hypothetical protein B0H10DRAFT_2441333 [Mycena sp. CBHHK59/15]|nr:hypothetical protein B0H10DRAFT_2441333 [Mycena sp. CBHHK59/15]
MSLTHLAPTAFDIGCGFGLDNNDHTQHCHVIQLVEIHVMARPTPIRSRSSSSFGSASSSASSVVSSFLTNEDDRDNVEEYCSSMEEGGNMEEDIDGAIQGQMGSILTWRAELLASASPMSITLAALNPNQKPADCYGENRDAEMFCSACDQHFGSHHAWKVHAADVD